MAKAEARLTTPEVDFPAMLAAQERRLARPDAKITPKQRKALEALQRLRIEAEKEVERLLDLLDRIAGDPDLEDSDEDEDRSDFEPSLAAPDALMNHVVAWNLSVDEGCCDLFLGGQDLELDTCDDEPEEDDDQSDYEPDHENYPAGSTGEPNQDWRGGFHVA